VLVKSSYKGGVVALDAALTDQATWVKHNCDLLIRNVERFIHGKDEVVRDAVICLLAEGHILIEDVPGVAKTSLAKAIANSIKGMMRRIQFTPDLLPSDVTGVQIYDSGSHTFDFRPGPVFANIVLGDEINRASPKTQSALLEAMAERQVTVDGVTYPLSRPNIVIATQNPIDHQGTYLLPEAQLDRFMMVLRIGYPSAGSEKDIVADAIARRAPEQLEPVLTTDDLLRMIEITRHVHVAPSIVDFVVNVTGTTRVMKQVRLGASPRASNALALASQARAACAGRSYVTVDDVKAVARQVLGHRLLLAPDTGLHGHTAGEVIDRILTTVPVPRHRDS
jgi:MoxR-like ATPase